MSFDLKNLNLLFIKKTDYLLDESIENIRSKIKVITDKKWSDFSENITGTLNSNNTFKFTPKWSFVYIRWIENSPAYLTGHVSQESTKTKLSIKTRPNSGFVLVFYVLIILFLYGLFTLQISDRDTIFKLLLDLFFIFIIYAFMKKFVTGLDRRFKKILELN